MPKGFVVFWLLFSIGCYAFEIQGDLQIHGTIQSTVTETITSTRTRTVSIIENLRSLWPEVGNIKHQTPVTAVEASAKVLAAQPATTSSLGAISIYHNGTPTWHHHANKTLGAASNHMHYHGHSFSHGRPLRLTSVVTGLNTQETSSSANPTSTVILSPSQSTQPKLNDTVFVSSGLPAMPRLPLGPSIIAILGSFITL
ncbi:hypothetical protein BDW75DRAFT_244936 [Aspergillus navahoensis]